MEDCKMAGRSLKAVAVLQSIGAIGLLAAIFIPVVQSGADISQQDLLFMLIVFLPVFSWLVGKGVSNQSSWSRYIAMVYCLLMLAGWPMGTIIGAYILFYLVRDRGLDTPNKKLQPTADAPAE